MEKQRELSDPLTMRLPVDLLKAYLAAEGADVLSLVKAREEYAAGLTYDLEDILAEVDAILEGKAA